MTTNKHASRRQFLCTSSTAAAGLALTPKVFSIGRPGGSALETINIGVVGTGGRGGGACNDNLTANENVRLAAMADLDPAKCDRLRKNLVKKHGQKVDVGDSRIYGGLDGFRKVIDDPNVDLVLLTTSPGFRPWHIAEAVKARKHVFAEKPVCVDPAGFRSCIDSHERAIKQETAIVTGTQYRRQPSFIEAIDRLQEGVLGEIVGATARYCSSGIWYRKRQEGMSDTEYQLHNWMHFIWLSGDQICEQAVHNVDVINWLMGGPPESAYGSGGRFTRPDDSEMWDSMSIDFMYPGNRMVSFKCRQIPGTKGDSNNVVYCADGIGYINAFSSGSRLVDRKGKEIFKIKGDIGAAYKQEHRDLIDSIRAGKPIVELKQTAESSLTAAMGRMACYTGQKVTWDFVSKKSKLDTFPKNLTMKGSRPTSTHAIPGKSKLV